jgi:electron transfer flavoprotein alpha subunit
MVRVLGWSNDDEACKQSRTKAQSLGQLISIDRTQLPDQDTATIAAGLHKVVTEKGIDLVIIGATKLTRDIGPRLAALLDWPFAGEVQSLEREGDGWTVSRMVLSGNSLATYRMGPKAVVTAIPGTFEADGDPEGEKVVLSAPASKVKITGTTGEEAGDFDLGSADYVVGVGRGFKNKDDLKMAEALAKALPGGAVGCSRPIAADLKWLGEEHWIGLSGHQIRPKIYFACGVSGQIQHVAGIRGAKLIVAINTNKDAPIFQVADYGIVGDLYKVLPKLAERLSK